MIQSRRSVQRGEKAVAAMQGTARRHDDAGWRATADLGPYSTPADINIPAGLSGKKTEMSASPSEYQKRLSYWYQKSLEPTRHEDAIRMPP